MAEKQSAGVLTKTVLVSGGMQDDVSAYQQSDPACAYIENGRFRKKDEIEKRLPHNPLPTTGLPTSGTPLMLAEHESTLVTMDNEGTLYTLDRDDAFNNTTWTSKATNVTPYNAEISFQSAPEAGAHCFQAGEVVSDTSENLKLMAWEVRKPGSYPGVTVPQTDVTMELRRKNGDLLDRITDDGSRHPRVVPVGTDNLPWCYYQRSDGVICARGISSSAFSAEYVTGISATLDHVDIAGLEANFPAATPGTFEREDGKIGLCEDGGLDGFWDVATAGVLTAWLWQDGTNLRVQKGFLFGPVGFAKTIVANSGSNRYSPISVALDAAGEKVGVLFAQYNTSSALGEIFFKEYDISGDTPVETESFGLGISAYVPQNGRIINGSLIFDTSGGGWRYACTVLGYSPDWINDPNVPNNNCCPVVLAGVCNTNINTFDVELYVQDYRLVTEVTLSTETPAFGEKADLVFGIEQWAPFAQPRSNIPQAEFASCPVSIRPHTTIVIGLPWGSQEYQIIATLGAGQNKGWNASGEEQSMQLNSAYVRDDSPYITTRNILQPEDISVQLGDSSSTASKKRFNVLFPGEAAGKVVKLAPSETIRTRKYGDATLFAMAVPCQYDGVAFGEQSVFDQPEITHIKATTGPDAYSDIAYEKLTEGDVDNYYVYQVVVGFADHLGQLHRSAPSTPLWVKGVEIGDLAAGDQQITIGFTTPLSAYRDQRQYFVEVFSAKGEEARHLSGTKAIDVSTGSGAESEIIFTNHVYNNNGQAEPIRWSEVLYTEGDVLPSDSWPAFTDFVITSNRLFAVGAEIPGTVYYSKLLEENIAPEFSAPLVISLGRGRTLTGVGAIDDKVIVFSKDEIFAIYDTGPDNTGANGDFVVDRLQTTVGCTDPQSIVEIPDGLFFYSDISKEFHLLSRDLQVHDIGKAVEDTAEGLTDIKSAIVVPDEHEVRWYVDTVIQQEYGPSPASSPVGPARVRRSNILPTKPALVYNYYYKKWCVHSHSDGQHAVLFQNQPTFIDSDWDVSQADPDAWGLDTNNRLMIRLPWVRMNQLQSFGRVESISFLGKYLSDWRDNGNGFEAGDINVKVLYDYEEYPYNPESQYDSVRYRANAGDLGNYNGRMQFDLSPSRQKCQAIQVELEEVASTAVEVWEPAYVNGRGWTISGMDILYTPKSGTGIKTMNQRGSK